MKKVIYILSDVFFLLSLTLLGKFKLDEQSFLLQKYQVVVTLFWVIGIFNFKKRKIEDEINDKLKDLLVLLLIIPLWFWISGEIQNDLYEPLTIIVHLICLGLIIFFTHISVKDIGSIAYYTHALIPIIAVLLINLNCPVICSVIVAVILPELINFRVYIKRCNQIEVTPHKKLRTSRRKCVSQIGIDKYSFNRKEELLRYKYLCCAKLSRREWKKCNNIPMPYSFQEWKKDIENKYSKYNKDQLEEFTRYLELQIRNSNISKQSIGIIIAAFASSSMTLLFEKIINSRQFLDVMGTQVSFLLAVVEIVLIILCIGIIVHYVFIPICGDELERNMYQDYQNIINQIIEEKNI